MCSSNCSHNKSVDFEQLSQELENARGEVASMAQLVADAAELSGEGDYEVPFEDMEALKNAIEEWNKKSQEVLKAVANTK